MQEWDFRSTTSAADVGVEYPASTLLKRPPSTTTVTRSRILPARTSTSFPQCRRVVAHRPGEPSRKKTNSILFTGWNTSRGDTHRLLGADQWARLLYSIALGHTTGRTGPQCTVGSQSRVKARFGRCRSANVESAWPNRATLCAGRDAIAGSGEYAVAWQSGWAGIPLSSGCSTL